MASNPADQAALARVEELLDQLGRVDLQVVVVVPPDAERVAARDRARAAAEAAGRSALFDGAAAEARDLATRAFARGGFSGTWAATDWSISVARAGDRAAAAAAFEEAAMAAIVEDLVDDDTLDVLRSTSEELHLATGIPSPGSLNSFTSVRLPTVRGPTGGVVLGAAIVLAILASFAAGPWIGVIVFVVGASAAGWLARRRTGSA